VARRPVSTEEATKSDSTVESPAVTIPTCRPSHRINGDVDEFSSVIAGLLHQFVQPRARETSKVSGLKDDRLP
jgi:hypothetical protein